MPSLLPPAVTFDYATWILRFPVFAAIPQALAQLYFDEAGILCANNTCNPYYCIGQLSILLNLLTAHIAWLNAPRDQNGNPAATGAPASAIVGRISSASEGSVSVSSENQYPTGTPQWYQQSQYGSEYWVLTSNSRTMRYAAQPTFVPNSIYPYGFGVRRGW